MLTADNIGHTYRGGPTVLRGVSFNFSGPGLLAVVGPSGSGKTTLLGILGGLHKPSRGSVTFAGRDVAEVEPGWLFQTPNVLLQRTAVDNVAIGVHRAGVGWRDALHLARRRLASYGLEDVSDRKARTLSGGEVQRLAVARAGLSAPDIVFADEPTAQLDYENSIMVAGALKQLADSGSVVVVASHDPSVAERADATVTIINGSASLVDHR